MRRPSKSGAVTVIEMLIVFGIIGHAGGAAGAGDDVGAEQRAHRAMPEQSPADRHGDSSYCQHYNGCIPAVTDFPTNQVWNNAAGAPDSLGVLVTQSYLAEPSTLFCPLDT